MPPPQRDPLVRVIAMPADVNSQGDIFGGWIMSLMDSGAGSLAMRYCSGRAVTVAVDRMEFLAPVKIGDEVSVYGSVGGQGRSSLQIDVDVWRRPRNQNKATKVTQARFTFVAIDDDGRPRPIEAD